MGHRKKFLSEDRPKAEKGKTKFLEDSASDEESCNEPVNADENASSKTDLSAEENGTNEKTAKKKSGVFSKLSAIWSIISAVYVTVAVAWFIIKNGLDGVVAKVLLGLLAAFVLGYITVVSISVSKNRESVKAGKSVKAYKKCLKIFKAATKVVFVAMSGVLLAGMNLNGVHGALQWIAFIATFAVALLQLVFMIVKMILKARRRHIKEKYKVTKRTFKK